MFRGKHTGISPYIGAVTNQCDVVISEICGEIKELKGHAIAAMCEFPMGEFAIAAYEVGSKVAKTKIIVLDQDLKKVLREHAINEKVVKMQCMFDGRIICFCNDEIAQRKNLVLDKSGKCFILKDIHLEAKDGSNIFCLLSEDTLAHISKDKRHLLVTQIQKEKTKKLAEAKIGEGEVVSLVCANNNILVSQGEDVHHFVCTIDSTTSKLALQPKEIVGPSGLKKIVALKDKFVIMGNVQTEILDATSLKVIMRSLKKISQNQHFVVPLQDQLVSINFQNQLPQILVFNNKFESAEVCLNVEKIVRSALPFFPTPLAKIVTAYAQDAMQTLEYYLQFKFAVLGKDLVCCYEGRMLRWQLGEFYEVQNVITSSITQGQSSEDDEAQQNYYTARTLP